MSEDNPDTSGLFTPGPSFDSAPAGDKERQAIDSLRGYAYQIAASTVAWIELDGTARLYLEVAEDYSTLADETLNAVQVKDTRASGAITLNSQSVRDAIAAYIDLVARNPRRTVHLYYLTTSDITAERRLDDRPGGEAGLIYWRKAAVAADVAPLRAILEGPNFSEEVRRFVQTRDNEALRADLLRKIHWQCGQSDFADLLHELEDRLVVLGTDRYRLRAPESKRLTNVLMYHVLRKSVLKTAADRVLTRADLDTLINSATGIMLQRSAVDAITAHAASALAGALAGGAPSVPTLSSSDLGWLVASTDIPPPRGLISRPTVKGAVAKILAAQGVVFLVGGTGVGKSLLAREVAEELAGDFVLADVRDATPIEARWRLDSVPGRLAEIASRALIIEDLGHFEDPRVLLSLGRVMNALRRRDRVALITCYRPPSARALGELGLDASAIVEVPYFSEDEVKAVVQANGADPGLWGKIAYLAGGTGHPQLVHAFVMGMTARGWPKSALKEIVVGGLTSDDVDAARDAARQRLVAALPEGARTLLYRLSLVIWRFDRTLALELGALPPPLTEPGEYLDQLVGSWIEAVGRRHYRVSPLAASAGRETLRPDEQQAVHDAIATRMLSRRTIEISDANIALGHALLGKSGRVLLALAASVLTTTPDIRRALRDHFFLLRSARTDALIYPDSGSISRMLRLAQFKLIAAGGDGEDISECVAVLFSESDAEPIEELRTVFETLALGTVLATRGIANYVHNWVDLILRFMEVVESDRKMLELKSNFEDTETQRGANTYSLLFSNGVAGIASVQRLEEILATLDALAPERRSILLEAYERHASDYHLLVSSPWLAAQNNKTLDWADAASRYARMGARAHAWGIAKLAAECHAARAVMFDEYGEDSATALRSLDEAVAILGDDVVLSRARAKIFWRHDDHVRAVEIMRRIADQIGRDSPIARCFALREAAISAAKTDDWALAERWFGEAASAAEQAKSDDMRPMAIGLGVDAAIEAFRSGGRARAIERLAQSLLALRTLDPDFSLRAAYCHRVTRHAVLWLQTQIEGRETIIDNQPIQMPPGTCSNPEPLEAIKEMPLGPIDIAWYMLAQAEIAAGEDLGIAKSLHEKQEKGPIPICEVMLRIKWAERAISESNVQLFAAHFREWLEGTAYVHAEGLSLRLSFNALDPPRGKVPPLAPSQLADDFVQAAAADAILAFLIVSTLQNRNDPSSPLEGQLTAQLENGFPGCGVFDQWKGKRTALSPLNHIVIRALLLLRQGEHLEPFRIWELGLRLFEKVRQSSFKGNLTPVLAKWMRAHWLRILSEERFRVSRPMATVPDVETALSNANDDERFVAALCLSASDAVGGPLAPGYREELQRMAVGS